MKRLFLGIFACILCLCACEKAESSADIRTGELRKTVFALVSSAENSSLDYAEQYDYIEDIGDGQGYTAGIVGFTSAAGDLLQVVQRYVQAKPTDNALEPYIPALKAAVGSDTHEGLDESFVQAWKDAAQDSKLIAAENAEVDAVYLNPAVEAAQEDGLGALGQYMYYDALVVHGAGDAQSGFGGMRTEAKQQCDPPAQGGSESVYLNTFLQVRMAVMEQEAVRPNLSRLEAQQKFLDENNYTLQLPLAWTMYGDAYQLTQEKLKEMP